VDLKMGLPAENTFVPTLRHTTLKLRIAAGVAQAAKIASAVTDAARPNTTRVPVPRFCTFDVDAAFLNGTNLTGRPRYVRPPPGFRTYDRRGVAIVWEMMGNCYGRSVWHRGFGTSRCTHT
jgi:hypothetical protein